MCSGRSNRKPVDNGWADQGGYMNSKKQKLSNQFSESICQVQSDIFTGIRVHVNGYTDPPITELKRMVQEYGGVFVQYYSKSAGDFMIANNLPLSKVKKLTDHKIVKAAWITDSVAARTLLPWRNYELYPTRGQIQNQANLKTAFAKLPISTETTVHSLDSIKSDSKSIECCEVSVLKESEMSLTETNSIHIISHCDSVSSSPSPHTRPEMESPLKSESGLGHLLRTGTTPTKPEDTTCSSSSLTSGMPRMMPTSSDGYLSEFYSHSRLHHLSTWASELRDLVRKLRSSVTVEGPSLLAAELDRLCEDDSSNILVLEPSSSSKSEAKLQTPPRILLHIDMDCFFVSVCLRNRPELQGHPVAVTHSRGIKGESQTAGSLSEVASCSYEARKFGIRNGMHLGDARKLCPALKTVAYDFDAFHEVSEQLYRLVARFTHNIEAVSCDELYADVTDLLARGASAKADTVRVLNPIVLAELLRRLVFETTHCHATCGLGTNRLLTRLATKRAKPNSAAFFIDSVWRLIGETPPAVLELAKPEGMSYLNKLPISDLPGIGSMMANKLEASCGVVTCGQLLSSVSSAQLSNLMGGKTGQRILQQCQGKDSNELVLDRFAKSISAEITYGIRFSSWFEVEKFVGSLSRELATRMANSATGDSCGVVGRSLVVRLLTRRADQPVEAAKFMGHGICDSWTRTLQLPSVTGEASVIKAHCLAALHRVAPEPSDIRGLGLQMQRLTPVSGCHLSSRRSKNGTHISDGNTKPISCFLNSLPAKPAAAASDAACKQLSGNIGCNSLVDQTSPNDTSEVNSFKQHSDENNQTPTKANTSHEFSSPIGKTPAYLDHTLNMATSTPARNLPNKERHQLSTVTTWVTPLCQNANRPIEEVNIFANRSIEQIESMLATWVTTESDPQEEDMCLLADYLISILPADLVRVRQILLALQHVLETLLEPSDISGFLLAFQRIKVTIDAACKLHYDADSLFL